LEDADRLDRQFKSSGFVGPLHGIPILVKDEIDTAGMPTTLGSVTFKDYRPPLDAFVVARLKKAGAIILGKMPSHFREGMRRIGIVVGVLGTVAGGIGGYFLAEHARASTGLLGERVLVDYALASSLLVVGFLVARFLRRSRSATALPGRRRVAETAAHAPHPFLKRSIDRQANGHLARTPGTDPRIGS